MVERDGSDCDNGDKEPGTKGVMGHSNGWDDIRDGDPDEHGDPSPRKDGH